jgi:hypothetical protein
MIQCANSHLPTPLLGAGTFLSQQNLLQLKVGCRPTALSSGVPIFMLSCCQLPVVAGGDPLLAIYALLTIMSFFWHKTIAFYSSHADHLLLSRCPR